MAYLHSVYGSLNVWSFKFEIEISMTSGKTKQLLRILKWQALVVSGHDNDKMDVIRQCQGVFSQIWMLWQGLCWSIWLLCADYKRWGKHQGI